MWNLPEAFPPPDSGEGSMLKYQLQQIQTNMQVIQTGTESSTSLNTQQQVIMIQSFAL